MSKVKVAVGAIIGAAAGFAAGILAAPQSGAETRAEIGKMGREVKAGAVKNADAFVGGAKIMADDLKDDATNTIESIKDKATDLKDRTESAIEGAKKGFLKK